MILAAGRGERMRPLTDALPKPLLEVGGKSLILRLVEALVAAGLPQIVINHAHLGHKIVEALGDGADVGAQIVYSHERGGGLETGGGIVHALPLLDSDPFVVVNGDILTDFPFARLRQTFAGVAHLVLVDNPPHHPGGDFFLSSPYVRTEGGPRLTFSGIGVYRRALFQDHASGKFPLAPLLRAAMMRSEVTGEYYAGDWWDIGTPERLAELDRRLSSPGPGG
jgi:MurNAc alpha-1-phosphate uridylyltransferase